MATWADRRDQYNAEMRGVARQEQERLRQEQQRNALADILRGAYEPAQAAQPAIYGPVREEYLGSVDPSGVGQEAMPERAGGFNMQNAIAAMARGGFGPEALKLQQEMENNALRQRSGVPSSVAETNWYLGQPENVQQTHERLKRAQQVMNLGGTQAVLDPRGGIRESFPVTPRPEQMPAFQAQQTAAKKTAEMRAEDTEKTKSDLPIKELSVERNLEQIDALKKHPGKKYAVGAYAILPDIPGTEQKNFRVALQQLKDTVFIENRQKLKGGGAITDFEGKKAESAEARLDAAQTPEAFDEALDDYKYWVEQGMAKLRQKAGSSAPSLKIPKGARTGTDEQGRKVFSTDGGKSVFDATTGQRIK